MLLHKLVIFSPVGNGDRTNCPTIVDFVVFNFPSFASFLKEIVFPDESKFSITEMFNKCDCHILGEECSN